MTCKSIHSFLRTRSISAFAEAISEMRWFDRLARRVRAERRRVYSEGEEGGADIGGVDDVGVEDVGVEDVCVGGGGAEDRVGGADVVAEGGV